jgi:transcriptional regulator with XRE-family HTH domain
VAEEWGRRVRAALVLRGYDIDDLAGELNISRRTFERTIRGERTPRAWETSRIEELLKLPDWFIPHGLERSKPPDVDGIPAAQVLAALERIEKLLLDMCGSRPCDPLTL